MTTSMSSHTESMLSKFSNYSMTLVDSKYEDLRIALEAARISAQNVFLNSCLSSCNNVHDSSFQFSKLSYSAETEGLSIADVQSLAKYLTETHEEDSIVETPICHSIQDAIEFLMNLHAQGSYTYPFDMSIGSSPRVTGAFYTPFQVSDYIAEKTLGLFIDSQEKEINDEYDHLSNIKILDPACGSGAFLLSAFKVLKNRYPNDDILGSLYGVDIDASALEVAHVLLHLLSHHEKIPQLHLDSSKNLRKGNSLISLKGWNSECDYSHFFEDPSSKLPFEWKEEFPEIFRDGGFNAILMNPPFNRLKPNRAEYERERTASRNHPLSFNDYKRRLMEKVDYFRNSGEYRLGNRYSIDTYRLFIERCLSLAKSHAQIGFIVPSTLLGDISAAALRRELLLNNTIHLLNEFPEGARLFADVTQSVCIMALEKGGITNSLDASFDLLSIDDARQSDFLRLKLSSIINYMGESLTIPRVAKHEWRILKKLHENPTLDSMDWLLCRRGELDLTLHKKYITTKHEYAPLIRGSHIGKYSLNNSSSQVSEFVDIDSFNGAYRTSERFSHIERTRIACQQVSNRSQRWRLKFSLIYPGTVLANSCNYIVLNENMNDNVLFYLLGILNSDLLNWRFSVSNTNNHVSNKELNALPIPDFTKFGKYKMEIFNLISEETYRLFESKKGSSLLIESYVHFLYGLNTNQTERIMRTRGATSNELDEIRTLLDHLSMNE